MTRADRRRDACAAFRTTLATAAAALAAACAPQPDTSSLDDTPSFDSVLVSGTDTVHIVASDDWQLVTARGDARRTLPDFIRRLQTPPATQTELGLKAPFGEGDVEVAWLDPLDYSDGHFRAVVVNMLGGPGRPHAGDTVSIDTTRVADWMAVDRDTLVGGFTIRVFRARLDAARQARADSLRGFAVVGDGTAELRHA